MKQLRRRATRRRNADPDFRKLLAARKAQRMSSRGGQVKFSGKIRISADERTRKGVRADLPPEAAAMLHDVWASGDPSRMQDTLEEMINAFYFENAVWADMLTVDDLSFRPQ